MNSLNEIKTCILQKSSLASVVQETVKCRKQLGRLVACCPFHEEKTPSFFIFDDNYHCFGCGAHGDVITFVREIHTLSFVEALKWLDSRFSLGISFLSPSRDDSRKLQQKKREEKIMSLSQDFFVSNLHSDAGNVAVNYLNSRGFSLEQIKEYGFGFALDSSRSLLKYLLKLGYLNREIEKCSLVQQSQRGEYDFFQYSLMIPIYSHLGSLIAFAGRSLADKPFQKYKNSRYDKAKILYGLERAKKYMKKKSRAILVEGYLDAMSMWSNGFEEAVACQGTSLSVQHVNLLKTYVSEVVLLFDGDSAGQKAALKAIDQIYTNTGGELLCKICVLPCEHDPDSYLRGEGVDSLELLLNSAIDSRDYLIKDYLKNSSSGSLPNIINQNFIPWLKKITNSVERVYLAQRIGYYTNFSASLLLDEARLNSSALSQIKQSTEVEKNIFGISRLAIDYIGHLYFLSTGIESEEIAKYIKFCKDIFYHHPEILNFSLQLTSSFAEKKERSLEVCLKWREVENSQVEELLSYLDVRKEAYICTDGNAKLEELMKIYYKEEIKKKIQLIKKQLFLIKSATNTRENSEWMLFVKEIVRLQKDSDAI
jgi:DNA primase